VKVLAVMAKRKQKQVDCHLKKMGLFCNDQPVHDDDCTYYSDAFNLGDAYLYLSSFCVIS
jgi:hypothetical protein